MKKILEIAVTTNKGKRRCNEDNFVCQNKLLRLNQDDVTRKKKSMIPCICGVCDGMGGLAEGKKTSYLAADYLCHCLPLPQEDIGKMILDLNLKIYQSELSKNNGTTLAMLYFAKDQIVAANVGDSKIFTYHERKLKQISVDHNEANFMNHVRKMNEISERGKHTLTQYIGISPEQFIIEPHMLKLSYEPMLFLLCSDGLTEQLTEDRIQSLLADHYEKSCSKISKLLVEEALRLGTRDNVTVMIVKVKV